MDESAKSKAFLMRRQGTPYSEIMTRLGFDQKDIRELLRGQPAFSDADIENIRIQYAEGIALHLIAKWHKITEPAVCYIALGISYPDSPGPIATARRGSKIRPDARRLTADDVRAIRELAGLVPQRELAETYGVCRGMIRKVIARTVYSDVPDE